MGMEIKDTREVLRYAQNDKKMLAFSQMQTFSNLKAFLFDMDGVLFDSMPNHAEAWYQVMHEHYGFVCDRTFFFLVEGSTGHQVIDDFFVEQRGRHATEWELEQYYKEKSQCFTQLGPAEPMKGAADVLRKVGERGLTRVVVTGSGQTSLINKLNLAYPGVFDWEHIVNGKDCPIGHGKPHPDPYLYGLRKAAGNTTPVDWEAEHPFDDHTEALSRTEAIVVENAPMGVQAARAAGIFTVAVNTGPLDAKVLSDAGANIVLSGMQELADRMDEVINIYEKWQRKLS